MKFVSGLLVGLLALSSCKRGSADPGVQKDLAARRDALLATRKQMADNRKNLQAKIDALAATGGDTRGLEQELKAETDKELELISSQVGELVARVDGASGDAAASNAKLAAEVARLDALVTKLEAALKAAGGGGGGAADNAKLLAEMQILSQKCGTSAAPVVIAAPPPKGGSYGKADVDALLTKARRGMSTKGLIASDLNPQDQGLEKDATSAIKEGDLGRAYVAAAQLASAVDGIRVDRSFVQAKMNRFNARFSSQKRDDATNKAMTDRLQQAMERFTAQDWGGANRLLNQMFVDL